MSRTTICECGGKYTSTSSHVKHQNTLKHVKYVKDEQMRVDLAEKQKHCDCNDCKIGYPCAIYCFTCYQSLKKGIFCGNHN